MPTRRTGKACCCRARCGRRRRSWSCRRRTCCSRCIAPELHVEPRPEGRAAMIERDVVELADPAAAVGAGRRRSAEQQRIRRAIEVEIARGHAIGLVVVVGGLGAQAAKMIVSVGACRERRAGAQVLVLGDPIGLQRNAVPRAELLILRVEAEIGQMIRAVVADAARGSAWRRCRRRPPRASSGPSSAPPRAANRARNS
jgi:hypothetical protein